jgi:hypothetical protein
VKVTSIVIFGAGYVLGTRAGRERYAQIIQMAQKASERLDAYDKNGGKPSDRLAQYIRTAVGDSGRG